MAGYTLIVPQKTFHRWTEELLHLRSLVVDETGLVVSAGFPKFFNYGERPEIDARIDATPFSHIRFRTKQDGSLVIGTRHPRTGKCWWRTRGAFGMHTLAPILERALSDYPQLEEEICRVGGFSYLFELTAPDNRIVLPYEDTRLTYLGLVTHDTLELSLNLPASCIAAFPPSAPNVDIDGDSIRRFAESVRRIDDTPLEGFVGALQDTPHRPPLLFKVKTDWYLHRHRLRSYLTPRRIYEALFRHDIRSYEEARPFFADMGLDFETMTSLDLSVQRYFNQMAWVMEMLARLRTRLSEAVALDPARKAVVAHMTQAIAGDPDMQQSATIWFSVAMHLLNQQPEKARLYALAAFVLDTSVHTVMDWLASPPPALDRSSAPSLT